MSRQYLNMIWANEAGQSVWLFRAEHGRLGIEIRGVVDQREAKLASATIEKHNLDRLINTIRLYYEQSAPVPETPVGGEANDAIQVPPPAHVKFTKRGRAYTDINRIIDTELARASTAPVAAAGDDEGVEQNASEITLRE